MSNLLENGFLMTLGAAAITREVAESIVGELVKHGQMTSDEGRQAVDEVIDKTKGEARSLRNRFDKTLQNSFQDLGLAPRQQMEDLQLKVAQLEHRINLLETAGNKDADSDAEGGETSGDGKTGKKSKGARR
ncbi:MAG: hypothetical protein WC911_06265 [Thermoleophilia bacterium]